MHCRILHFALFLPTLLSPGCVWNEPLKLDRLRDDLQQVQQTAPDKWTSAEKHAERGDNPWLRDFDSPQLTAFVREAQQANPDLRAAAARLRQANAQLAAATATLIPTLDISGSASRSQRPGDQRFPGLGQRANRFNPALEMSWELDLWGRLTDQRRATAADTRASGADYDAASLSLAANTVKGAVLLTQSEEQIRLAEENVATRRTQLSLLDKRLDRGIDPEEAALALSLGRADLARAESAVSEQKQAADNARRSLETLLGRYPAGRESGLSSLPSLRRTVPSGLPAELLSRRPDVLAAEDRLFAALNLESAARKALLPSIRLTGDRGFSSQQLTDLISLQSTVWTIASQTTQPLFQGGRLRAGIKQSRARYDEALNQYASIMLTAFREVETALAAEQFLMEQERSLATASSEAERSEKLALSQYSRGLVDVLTVLDSQQRAYDARRAFIAVRAARLANRVDLHLALGGAFE